MITKPKKRNHILSPLITAVIIVTHDASITKLSDKTYYIYDGKVIKKDNYLGKVKSKL